MAYTSLSGSKLRNKLGASLNEGVSAPTSKFAQAQLEKLGWSAGEGLGKNRQGMSSHIKVTKRQDEVGLGHSGSTETSAKAMATTQWWKDSVGDTLAKLSASKSKKSKKSSSKKRKREYTDEELFEATGGARFGMRAQRKAKAKWARTESQTEDDERQAMEKIEWNGRGSAEIKLNSESSSNDDDDDDARHKKKRRRESNEGSETGEDSWSTKDGVSSGTESDKPKKKKKNKRDKKQKEKKKTKSSKKSKKEKKSKQ